MATPAMTAPLGSDTVPVSVPRSVCANAATENTNRQRRVCTFFIVHLSSAVSRKVIVSILLKGFRKRNKITSLLQCQSAESFLMNLRGVAHLNSGIIHGGAPRISSECAWSVSKSECEPSDDLSGSRLSTTVERSAWRISAVDPIDIPVAGCQPSRRVESFRRGGIRAGERYVERTTADRNWACQKQAIKYVLEIDADLQFDLSLTVHDKVPAQAQRLRRPALPAIVVVVGGGGPKLPRGRVGPGCRI